MFDKSEAANMVDLYLAEDSDADLEIVSFALRLSLQHPDDGNERGGMVNHDWLEVVGNPTAPKATSPRGPRSNNTRIDPKRETFGVTRRAVTQRYLERMGRDRERKKDALMESIERLPITIRQMVYPQRPVMKDKESWRAESGLMSSRSKFRLPANPDDSGWNHDVEEWIKGDYSADTPRLPPPEQRKNIHCGGSVYSSTEHRCPSQSAVSAPPIMGSGNDFVHHPGFQGTIGQMNNFKLKCGKKNKLLNVADANTSIQSHKPPFKPNGFGSLYDEMEFQRRYKKVFDLNKHINFVHSNFVSGQKLVKRTKLPPIGPNSSLQPDDPDSLDIFAIMSVQQYNHPDGGDGSRAPVTSPGNPDMVSETSKITCYNCQNSPCPPLSHKNIEIPQSDSIPVGFLPGTIRTSGNSPFDGVKGSTMTSTSLPRSSNFRLLSFSKEGNEGESEAAQAEEGTGMNPVQMQGSPSPRIKPKLLTDRYRKFPTNRKRVSQKQKDAENDSDDAEPFNISVKVEIKPKEPSFPKSPTADDRVKSNEQEIDMDSFKEKIIYATKFHNEVPTDARWYSGHDERDTRSRNFSKISNHFGHVTQNGPHIGRFKASKTSAELYERQQQVYLLNVPRSPDSVELDERTQILSPRSESTLSSGHSIPEIRRTCPTPVSLVPVDAE